MAQTGTRIAWMFPSLERAKYWQPIFREFSRIFPETIVYTGLWSGFSQGYEGTFQVQVVGQTRYVADLSAAESYTCRLIMAPPGVVRYLMRFKPNVIFVSGFSIWTLLAVLLKVWFQWRVVVLFDGNSPGVDHRSSKLRYVVRRLMAGAIDAYAANSREAQDYLTEFMRVRSEKIFARPYLVPHAAALLQSQSAAIALPATHQPRFLFVGDLITRKGLPALLQACASLQQQGIDRYSLWIVGDGAQRAEFEEFARSHQIRDRISWFGWVEYGQLGAYFQQADVFVFPTFEDIWGMVVLEAMVLGKPVLCSRWAGAAELVRPGENGNLFDPHQLDPHQPESLAAEMRRLIEQPEQIAAMGARSQATIAPYTPQAATQLFVEIVATVLKRPLVAPDLNSQITEG